MQHFHPDRHWPMDAVDPAFACKKTTLESKDGLAAGPVNGRADDEQTVRCARTLVPWRVSTANNDFGRPLLDNLEVVCKLGAGRV